MHCLLVRSLPHSHKGAPFSSRQQVSLSLALPLLLSLSFWFSLSCSLSLSRFLCLSLSRSLTLSHSLSLSRSLARSLSLSFSFTLSLSLSVSIPLSRSRFARRHAAGSRNAPWLEPFSVGMCLNPFAVFSPRAEQAEFANPESTTTCTSSTTTYMAQTSSAPDRCRANSAHIRQSRPESGLDGRLLPPSPAQNYKPSTLNP